jgi:outer membrane lipoprotein-sorting protein
MSSSRRSRRLHWAAPFVVASIIGLVALAPTLSAGASTPSLAPLTPQQLLVKAQQAKVNALSGSIRLTANLGIPNLGSLAAVSGRDSAFSPLSLLSGSHDARVWFDGPDRQRIAMASSLAESDVIHNGADVWTWASSGSVVHHWHSTTTSKKSGKADTEAKTGTMPTPDQAAKQVLDQITPSTGVTVTTPAYVAGRSVYELVLRPNAAQSTVDHVGIAVDSATGLPLQVSLFAKGATTPALQLGFTSISFSRPAASTFNFSPPPNAHVTTNGSALNAFSNPRTERRQADVAGPSDVGPIVGVPPQAGQSGQSGQTKYAGQDWTSVVIAANSSGLPAQANIVLRASTAVSGSWGSGRLVQSSLINVLLLDDGRVAIGAVTPAALEAAVASAH